MPEYLAWPVATIIIAIVSVYILKSAIIRLIDRTSSAGKDGFTFERPQDGGDRAKPLPFDELMKLPMSPTALEREDLIKERLHENNLTDKDELISVLTRSLATTKIELEFIDISNLIYGSQLSFLNQLSGTAHGIQSDLAKDAFGHAQQIFQDVHSKVLLKVGLDI
jgi:hypothetical protein